MKTSRSRLLAITGATLALAVAGTAAVSAHPHDRGDDHGFGRDRAGAQLERGAKSIFGQRQGLRGLREGAGLRGELRRGISDRLDQFVRRESTLQTEDGITIHRVDNGTVAVSGDSGLEYTLATGETATVTTDEDTTIVAFSQQTVEVGRLGISRQRMVPEQITLADIEAGSDVIVWADSSDGTTFLAKRIVVQPELEATDTDVEAAPAGDEAALAPVVEA